MADWEHPDLRNIAGELPENELGEIAERCIEEHKKDEESRKSWMAMHADWLRLYFQKDVPLNPPWEGASSESMPLLAEACNQFHARAFPALFAGQDIVTARPVGRPDPASKERAKRIARHMSWQLLVKDRSYKRNKDRLLLSVPLHGSYFTKSYYDPALQRNVVENVRAVDLVVPYGTGPRDLEDIERKGHIINTSVNRTRILKKTGYFIDEATPWSLDEKSDLDEAHEKIEGIQDPVYDEKTICRLVEQHRLLDLDGDGIEEPYIVTIDLESEKVLRIAIRYETDELGDPVPSQWYDLKAPIEYFTHYTFLENPDGFYGLGYGHLIGQMNIAANKMLRQSVDAATLANVGNMSGFISETLGVKGGETRLQLGKFTKIPASVDDINRAIYQFKFPGPQQALLEIMGLIMQRSDRLAMVTEALTGETQKVMQPTTILALIEQGLQPFSAAFERIVNAQTMEFEKLYRLNRKFMDPTEYFAVQDIDGALVDMSATRDDYDDDFQVMTAADPRQVTKQQKLTKAQAEYQTLMANPLVLSSPMHIYETTRRFLEAIESEDIGEVLPKPTNNLPRTDDPLVENQGAMLTPAMVPMVYPDQDHKMHIQAHQQALINPRMTQGGYYALAEHIQGHLRYQSYGGGAGLAPLAPAGGNGMGAPSVDTAVQPGGGFDMGAGGVGEGPLQAQGPAGRVPGSGADIGIGQT